LNPKVGKRRNSSRTLKMNRRAKQCRKVGAVCNPKIELEEKTVEGVGLWPASKSARPNVGQENSYNR